MDCHELDESKRDKIISIGQVVVPLTLGIPSYLIEIFVSLIPNQRIDRISQFLKILGQKVSDLGISVENLLLNLEKQKEYFSLLENGLFYAYRATSEERLEYISSIILNGLTKEQAEMSRYIYLLGLLSELNDEEIIWLRFYLKPYLGCEEDKEFRDTHKETLARARTFIGAPVENLDRDALQNSYIAHLERLKLIKSKIKIDRKTNLPIINKSSGEFEKESREITHLGRMLLKEIGLFSE